MLFMWASGGFSKYVAFFSVHKPLQEDPWIIHMIAGSCCPVSDMYIYIHNKRFGTWLQSRLNVVYCLVSDFLK